MTDVADRLTHQTTELLQALIRNACVNDGTPDSGHESRSAELLAGGFEGCGAEVELFEVTAGRASLVARLPGTDPSAPALCLMGHTDVVPVSPEGWRHDPFGGELIDGEVWGRGAVDMLNLTSSMAVAFRHIATSGTRYPGDLVYFAVADEEAGGVAGARPLVEDSWDALGCDYVLTEYGGTPTTTADGTIVLMTTAEKGMSPQQITVHGEPGHGSMPFNTDNALVKAAEVVRRIAEFTPEPRIDDMFRTRVKAMGLPDEVQAMLLDPGRHAEAYAHIEPALGRNLHSCAHMSFSPNMIDGGVKMNVIPDSVEIIVDIRTLPGETDEDVLNNLRQALGEDLFADITIEPVKVGMQSTQSTTDTPLWAALVEATQMAYPGATVLPSMVTGGTDSRFFRQRGVPCYGAGLLSPRVTPEEFLNRFHGHNERIDVESLRMTTKLWLDICDRFWARL